MNTTATQWLDRPLTSRERVLRALAGESVDRPATVTPTSVATVEMMDLVDAPFPKVHRDAETMTRLAETAHTELGFDTITPVFSVVQESAALGIEMNWMDKTNWPTCISPQCKRPEDIKFRKDWIKAPEASCVIESIRELRRRHPDVCIIGKTMGPWTMGYHWFGTEAFLLMTCTEPQTIERALQVMKQSTYEFGYAQIEAGADMLTLPDHATGDLVGADYYRRFLLDLHCEFGETFPCPLIMHICGRTVDRMPDIGKTGFTAFHFDSKNLPSESLEAIGSKVKLVGNVNNPHALFKSAPEVAYAESVRAMNAGVRCVGPECAIPLLTPAENLRAIARAARDYPGLSEDERRDWERRAPVYDNKGGVVNEQ